MAFSITSAANPSANPNTTQSTPAAQSARDRAISALMGTAPAVNQNQVSPEEQTAVKPLVKSDTIEASPETKPIEATTTKEEPLSTQYAILARKEKALRAKAHQQEQALKAKEAALLAREEALKAKDSEYQTKYVSKDKLQNSTLETLAELGFSGDQLTQLALNAPSQESLAFKAEINSLKAELRALKDEQSGVQKTFAERDLQAEQQVLTQFKRETKSLIDSDPEFETIKATDSVDDVVSLIHKTFKEDGILLTVEEACKEVEAYLVEEATKLTKLSKIQKLMAAKASATEPKAAESTKQAQPMKTLTNSVSASRPLTAKERAVLAFKGEKF